MGPDSVRFPTPPRALCWCVALLVLAWLAGPFAETGVERRMFDGSLGQSGLTRTPLVWIGRLTEPLVVVGIALLTVAAAFRTLDRALPLSLPILATLAATFVLKIAVARPRPLLGLDESGASWPSGHAAVAMALALSFTMLARRERWPHRSVLELLALLAATAVGLARLAMGVHWPTDVLAGWLVAASCVAAYWWAHDRLNPRFEPAP